MDWEFLDDDAVIRLGEAILSQLQQDYINCYRAVIVDGPDARCKNFGHKGYVSARCALKEMEEYIYSSFLTAYHAESIIEELRRQGEVLASKGGNAKKLLWRDKAIREKGVI